MTYQYTFDIAALLIAIIVLLEYCVRNTISSRQAKAFLQIVFVSMFATCFDLASVFALKYAEVLPLWFNHALLFGFEVFFQAMAPCYFYYIVASSRREEEKLSLTEKLLVYAPYSLVWILLILNPFFHVIYKIENYKYIPQIGSRVFYILAFYYIIMAIVYLVKSKHKMTIGHKIVVASYTIISLSAILIQFIFPSLLIIDFGVELCVLVMAFTLESPAYYEEQQLGIFNRYAFQTVCSRGIATGKPFTVIGIRVEGLTDLRELVGMDSINRTLKEITKFLLSIGGRKKLFCISEAHFAIISYSGESEVEMYTRRIMNRFRTPFDAGTEKLRPTVLMSRLSFPKDVTTTESIMDLLEYSLSKASTVEEPVFVANSDLLLEKQRITKIVKLLKKALVEDGFSVYYQPIYSVEQGTFTSAEALLRLYDDELGFISPDEFISIAEKNGLIIKIGDYVFRKVCEFMAENRLWEKGIEYIDINLSPVQLIQEDLHEHIAAIMDEYKLDYGRISLEIAESPAVMTERVFKTNMQTLIKKGMRFSLDNYGTGFANLTTVVEYPFTIVKLDKTMLWSAMKNDKAMTVLRQTIRMMKQLSMELIAEGVETEEQSQLLAYYGCDFFQGYYYAKPQNTASFIKLLEEKKQGSESAHHFET